MPKSLRVKLGGLRYKGILEDKDYKRLCKALDNEDVLEKIRAEIKQMNFDFGDFYDHTSTIREMILEVVNKYKEGEADDE